MAYPVGQATYFPVPGLQAPVMYGAVPGYEGLVPGSSGGFIPPPPIQPMPTPDPQPIPNWSIPALTEEAAREALRKHVDNNCCWSSNPVKESVITNTEQCNTYRYRLETFTESRKTEWATKAYDGHPVNSYTMPPPGPWAVPVEQPVMFKNSVKELEVPYTSSVKPCDKCTATGKCACTACASSGTKVCSRCSGSGKILEENCSDCSGEGKKMCGDCSGEGLKECETCKGKKQLLSYIKLTVEWKNNVEDYTAEEASGLKKELKTVGGKLLFKDTKYLVYPPLGFPDSNLVQASDRMVKDHHSKYSQTVRILQQQQTIELIPINKVTSQWKGKTFFYYVYGNESEVKADDYPDQCCCIIL